MPPAKRKTRPLIADGFRRLSAENGDELDRQGALKQIPVNNRRLFQRGVDRRELRIEGGTKTVNRGDNGKADAGSNQAVFDRGSARLIGPEFCEKFLHSTSWNRSGPILRADA